MREVREPADYAEIGAALVDEFAPSHSGAHRARLRAVDGPPRSALQHRCDHRGWPSSRSSALGTSGLVAIAGSGGGRFVLGLDGVVVQSKQAPRNRHRSDGHRHRRRHTELSRRANNGPRITRKMEGALHRLGVGERHHSVGHWDRPEVRPVEHGIVGQI